MEKLPIKKVVEGLLKLQDSGDSATSVSYTHLTLPTIA